ncbi:hypothetical protein EKK58_06290 [Candidatus Dependentiae bacterium]|nr:MAG: hypothetical protein EKK58_06290 [Candidatus Dependentiae bacterium]
MHNVYTLCILTTIFGNIYAMENKYKALDQLVEGHTRIGQAQLPVEFISDIHFLNNLKYDDLSKKVHAHLPIKTHDNKGRQSIIANMYKKDPEATLAFLNSVVIHPKN